MTIFIFLGPTLSRQEAAPELEAVYLPPAVQGDIYRLVAQRPQAIGLVDGYFELVPSVWHKEILWAMKQGIHVFGAASMGALRAVELGAFGLEGVGTIVEWYRTGLIDGDDEVAVSHGAAADEYVATSTALVDIRATLRKAQQCGVIDEPLRQSIEQLAKHLYYPHRIYPAILQAAQAQGLPRAPLEALRDWLPANKVNQKHDDALALLRRMRERFSDNAEPAAPKQVRYTFQHTIFWNEAKKRLDRVAPMPGQNQTSDLHAAVQPTEPGAYIVRSEKSGAYRQFCEAVYGRSIIQFNMVDAEQLDKLLEVLHLGVESHVLDLGCASGILTEYISDMTRATITGIDTVSAAIRQAQDRIAAVNKRHRLRFLCASMENLDSLGAAFDAILAIDTLYFVEDLVGMVRQMKNHLKPQGQMGLFYSQVGSFDAERTTLAHALKANMLTYRAYDFTDNERRFWQHSKETAERLRSAFLAEGNLDLYEARIRESDLNLQRDLRRYLYVSG